MNYVYVTLISNDRFMKYRHLFFLTNLALLQGKQINVWIVSLVFLHVSQKKEMGLKIFILSCHVAYHLVHTTHINYLDAVVSPSAHSHAKNAPH